MFNRLDIASDTVDPDRHLDGKIEIYGNGVIMLFSDGPWIGDPGLTFRTHAHHLITAPLRLSLPALDERNTALQSTVSVSDQHGVVQAGVADPVAVGFAGFV